MNETYWIIAIVVLEKKSQSYHFYQIIFIHSSFNADFMLFSYLGNCKQLAMNTNIVHSLQWTPTLFIHCNEHRCAYVISN